MPLSQLCNDNKKMKLRFDAHLSGNPTPIHSEVASIDDITPGLTLNSSKNSALIFDKPVFKSLPKFFNLLQANWELKLTLAVDFSDTVNHTVIDKDENQYTKAILGIAEQLQPYS